MNDKLEINTPVKPEPSAPEKASTFQGKPLLSKEQLELILWVEEIWLSERRFPSNDDLKKRFSLTEADLLNIVNDPKVQLAFDNRGIDYAKQHGSLSPVQVSAVSLVLGSVGDRRSLNSKLKSLGVTEQTWRSWMKQKRFKSYVNQRAQEVFHDFEPEARIALMQSVSKGDFNAIKYYFEMTGVYNPKQEEVLQVQIIITKLMEAIQRHVEPKQLEAIQLEFEAIISGRQNNVIVMQQRELEQGS